MILLCILFCLSSTVLGYTLILFFLKRPWQFTIHVFSGWIVGQIVSSLFIFVITYFTIISPEIIFLISLIMLIISLFAYIYLWKNCDHNIFEIAFEHSSLYYFAVFIISIISFIYLGNVYQYFPYSLPKISISLLDDEISFISSVLYGINRKRSNFFTFKDPNNLNSTFNRPILPLLFASTIASFDYDLKNVLFFIHFLNTIGTTVILYYFCIIQNGKGLLFVFLMMLNGGMAFFHHFFSKNENIDYIHEVGFRVPLPIYHFFAHHLSFSLSSSVSIPLTILSLCFAEDDDKNINVHIFGGFLASLIPNFLTSISVFLIAFCNKESTKGFLPFAFSLVIKYFQSDIIVMPIWREFQNEGYRFSQIFIWFEAFGPLFFTIFYSFKMQNDQKFFYYYLARFSIFLLLCVFRNGKDTFENSLAINCIFFPFLVLSFSEIICNIIYRYRYKNSVMKGIVFAICFLCILTFLIGGIFCLHNSEKNRKYKLIDKSDEEIGKFINLNIPFNSLIFARPRRFQPASFLAGRQVLIGYPNDVWKNGNENVVKYLSFYRSIDHHINSTIDIMEEIKTSYVLANKNDSNFIFSFDDYNKYNYKITKLYDNDEWLFCQVTKDPS